MPKQEALDDFRRNLRSTNLSCTFGGVFISKATQFSLLENLLSPFLAAPRLKTFPLFGNGRFFRVPIAFLLAHTVSKIFSNY
ncbi:MAG: hypothetical protein IPM82_16005 [Saprospiraceae bacterium]|nr:hypothetical protein [Saprospiraceae bacterium]